MNVVDLSSDEDKDDDDELVVIEELPRRTASVQVILDASEMFFFLLYSLFGQFSLNLFITAI